MSAMIWFPWRHPTQQSNKTYYWITTCKTTINLQMSVHGKPKIFNNLSKDCQDTAVNPLTKHIKKV